MSLNEPPKTCDQNRLLAFVDGTLTGDDLSGLERHLDDCTDCQHALSELSAADMEWKDVSRFLRDDESDLISLSSSGHTAIDSASSDFGAARMATRQALDLLSASDDPHMLGRIGAYEVSGLIGSGGMGVVFKGFDRSLNRFVAIKVLAPHLATIGSARRRFAREAQAAAAVVHDNVIEIYGVSENHDPPYIVMPYVNGVSLQKRITDSGPLQLTEILRIGMQTAAGLAAAHAQGLVHRNIKPANILLPNGVERVRITDFGLARAADDASLTRSGVIAGTPQFMSPEQARGDAIDHRSDLFSLGSLLYAMCTGRAPFRAETSYGVLRRITDTAARPIREINPEIPDWLCSITTRLHAKTPEDRFQSAEEVSNLLSDCLHHAQTPDHPLPVSLQKQTNANVRQWWIVAAACLSLLAIGLTASYWTSPPAVVPVTESPESGPFVEIHTVTNNIAPEEIALDEETSWDDGVDVMLRRLSSDTNRLDQATQTNESQSESPHDKQNDQ